MPIFSSLDKDQIKVVIDEVTRWLDLAEEGDWMTLPGIAGSQGWPHDLGAGSVTCGEHPFTSGGSWASAL